MTTTRLNLTHSEVTHADKRKQQAARRAARRWVKRGAIALFVAAGVAGVMWAWMPKPVPAELATARRGSLETFVEAEGRTRVRDRFVVLAPASGVLLRVGLDAGAEVSAGAKLALIRPPEPALLDERSRADLRARLTAAKAREQQAKTALTRARTAHELAVTEAERARALGNTIAAAERERALAEERMAAAELAAAEQGLAIAAADVRAVEAMLGRGPGGGVEDVVVEAPSSGHVLRVMRESAGPIAAGTPIMEIGDLGQMEVVMDVLSQDAVRIQVGAEVVIEQWGGEPVRGRVVRIEPSAFTQISALGVEEQRVNVVVEIVGEAPGLGDGFRVEARVQVWQGEDVLTVPASALFRDGQAWAVYAVDEERKARLRRVEIGHRGKMEVEVVGGVQEGDEVVLYPGSKVKDGVEVVER